MRLARSVVGRALFGPALLIVSLVGLFFSYRSFEKAMTPAPPSRHYEAAIVFTGAFERHHAGVKLLEAGRIDRLFISGANPNAGIRPANFLVDFGAPHPRLAHFLDCCIEFGERADSTIENALESQCWIRARNIRGPILLVTSARHMPRAMAAARGWIGDVEIEPFAVADVDRRSPEAALRSESVEFMKYLATRALTWAPGSVVRKALGAEWRQGCPKP